MSLCNICVFHAYSFYREQVTQFYKEIVLISNNNNNGHMVCSYPEPLCDPVCTCVNPLFAWNWLFIDSGDTTCIGGGQLWVRLWLTSTESHSNSSRKPLNLTFLCSRCLLFQCRRESCRKMLWKRMFGLLCLPFCHCHIDQDKLLENVWMGPAQKMQKVWRCIWFASFWWRDV